MSSSEFSYTPLRRTGFALKSAGLDRHVRPEREPLRKPGVPGRLEHAIELETVLPRVTKMKFSSTPGSVGGRSPWTAFFARFANAATGNKLPVDLIDVADCKATCRPIDRMRPLVHTRPLQVQLDSVATHGRVSRLQRVVLKGQVESKPTVEVHRRHHVVRGQDRMNGVDPSGHG